MPAESKPPSPQDFSLLDGVSTPAIDLSTDYEPLQQIAADPERPMVERLAAYEDIFESEVGDTTIARARNIERSQGMRQLFLKFEGSNPTGTQKDRIAFAQHRDH